MLGDVKANSHSRGIPLANLEIDIAHRGIKRAGIGVWDVANRGHGTRRRRHRMIVAEKCSYASRAGSSGPGTCKEDHVSDSLLESWSVIRQDKDGTVRSIADNSNSGPDENGAGDAIAALRNKDDPFSRGLLKPVDRRLNRSAVIGLTVAVNRKPIRG